MKDRFGLRWVVDRLDLRDVLLHMDRFILWSGGLVHYGLGRTVDRARLVNVVVNIKPSVVVDLLVKRLGNVRRRRVNNLEHTISRLSEFPWSNGGTMRHRPYRCVSKDLQHTALRHL